MISLKFFWPGEFTQKAAYKGMSNMGWQKDHRYFYELRSAVPLPDSVFFAHVIGDLELNLKVKSSLELRQRDCRVVRLDDPARLGKIVWKQNGKPGITLNGSILEMREVSVGYLLAWMEDWVSHSSADKIMVPYLNQTGYKGVFSAKVDLGLELSLYHSREHLQNLLKSQLGFAFSIKQAKFPVLVIRDNGG